jgi:hypothetical protein
VYPIKKQNNKLNSYQKAFLIIYLFTVLSGAFRKWIISDKQIGNVILFLQILVPFAFIFIRNGMKNWQIGKPQFVVLILILLIGAVNPLNLTINHGLLGILLHGSFFFMIFFYINNRQYFQFEQIAGILLLGGLLQLLLAFFQYTQPADSFINTYVDVESVGGVALVGNSIRVTGTFSYISGFTGFLFFNSLLIWALVKYNYKSIYILLLLLFGITACFMSGARAATYTYLIIVAVIAFTEPILFSKSIVDFKSFLPILVIITIVIGFGSEKIVDLLSNSFTGFIERRTRGIESGEESTRIFGDFYEIINFRGSFPIMGVGLGSTYQGANKIFGTSNYVLEYGFFESELVRIVLEGGFLLLTTRLMILIYLLRKLFIPTISKIIIFILLLFFFPYVFNLYNAVFAALGIILVDYFYFESIISRQNAVSKQNSFQYPFTIKN